MYMAFTKNLLSNFYTSGQFSVSSFQYRKLETDHSKLSNNPMQDFKNLKVWQKAHELALYTYRITTTFPKEELFGLRNTLRKTSVDVPAAIAEGCAKENNAEFSRLIANAIALANRLEYFALVARDLEMLNEAVHTEYVDYIVEVRKMLSGFNQRLV